MVPWCVNKKRPGYCGGPQKLYKFGIVIPNVHRYSEQEVIKTIYTIRRTIKLFRTKDYYFEPEGLFSECMNFVYERKQCNFNYDFICDRNTYFGIIKLRECFDFNLRRLW